MLLAERTKGHLPLDEWGPKCAGCGGEEFRIDGYCSIECRDFHDDEDIGELARDVLVLERALREISAMPAGADDDGIACGAIARAALSAVSGDTPTNNERTEDD